MTGCLQGQENTAYQFGTEATVTLKFVNLTRCTPVSSISSKTQRSTLSSLLISAFSGDTWYLSSVSPYSFRMRVTWSEAVQPSTVSHSAGQLISCQTSTALISKGEEWDLPARKLAASLLLCMSDRFTRASVALCKIGPGRVYPLAHSLESPALCKMSMMTFCMRPSKRLMNPFPTMDSTKTTKESKSSAPANVVTTSCH